MNALTSKPSQGTDLVATVSILMMGCHMGLFDVLAKLVSSNMKELDFSDPKASIEDVVKGLKRQIDEWESTKVRVAITGQSGSGKSSLINTIMGEKVAEVGVTETTMKPKTYESKHGISFTDLPGCGTQNFPFDADGIKKKYVDEMNLSSYDAVILVTSNRFHEDDVKLYKYVTEKMQKPIFLVRTKMDSAVEEGEEDNNLTREQVVDIILKDIAKNIKIDDMSKIYLTSSKKKKVADFDVDRLVRDVANAIPEVKREKFILETAAYSEASIKAKRPIVEELSKRYAFLSAANGLNPIPGLNVSIDVALLAKMSNNILSNYGLIGGAFEQIAKSKEDKGALVGTVSGTVKWATQYATEAGIKAILPRLVAGEAAKSVASWVPLVGQAVAAGLGYLIASRYATKLIDESEEKAILLLTEYAHAYA